MTFRPLCMCRFSQNGRDSSNERLDLLPRKEIERPARTLAARGPRVKSLWHVLGSHFQYPHVRHHEAKLRARRRLLAAAQTLAKSGTGPPGAEDPTANRV